MLQLLGHSTPSDGRGASGVNRREFIRLCSLAAASIGLPAALGVKMAEAVIASPAKPSVIWLHFQECTGCTESLLRTTHPGLAELLLDLISLDYHETLFAAAGHQIEAALHSAMERHAGKYICVIEGSIPTKDGGIYCKIGGRTALEMVQDVAGKAGAIVAIGSCASFGGLPASDPNPTGAEGAPAVLPGKTVVTIPGCPPNPYNLLGTVLQYATYGTLPKLDAKGRPLFAYARTVHEDCPRRPHFDAGRFASLFGDEGHRQGWCLYKLGCKGPQTYANCSLQSFCEVPGTWPVGVGHPCFGCTEEALAFRVPLHATVPIDRPTPPDTFAPVQPEAPAISPVATGVAGLVGGALLGAGFMASKKLGPPEEEEQS
jgi:hydrogenase small subunit